MKNYTKHIITGELLFIFVLLSIAFISSNGVSITGFQVAEGPTQESIRQEIETALPEFDFIQEIDDMTLCLIVRMNPLVSYSYDIIKIGEAVVVSNADSEFCKGEETEDFIVSYVSYEKLQEHLQTTPSLSELKAVGDGTSFYLYPSRQILPGVKISKPDEFNQKFGTVATKYFTADEIKQFKTPATQSPAPTIVSYLLYSIGGVLIVVTLLTVVLLKTSKKPTVVEDLELVSYIKSMTAQGYQEFQIRQTLVQNGWKPENIDQAFNQAKSEVSVPQGFNT